jgi:hypothetical protein
MKKNIAEDMSEPPNGTVLVITEGASPPIAIYRDDDLARTSGQEHPDERWFDDKDVSPVNWHEVMRYADEVYGVTEKPIKTREHN